MGIRKKFFALIGSVALILAVVSCVGYYMAYTYLSQSIENEVRSAVQSEANTLNGWLEKKAEVAVGAAREFKNLDPAVVDSVGSRQYLSMVDGDKEIMDLSSGTEKGGLFISWKDGDVTKDADPRTRPWYKEAKAAGKPIFTEVYKNIGGADDGKLVISVGVPYNDKNGNFAGALCEDITLDVLDKVIANVKYRDQGTGIIIDKTGQIIATSGKEEKMSNVSEDPALKDHYQSMLSQPQGMFDVQQDGKTQVFAYTSLPDSGLIMGVSVPKDFVYASLTRMKIVYAVLVVLGILLVGAGGVTFSKRISSAIIRLNGHADELAKGNLTVENLEITSSDEIGSLTQAFNTMSHNIRELIKKMAATSEQVAASSEELTASAQQSAEAANHVAVTVSKVADGMGNQMKNIDSAKSEVDAVFNDMSQVAEKTKKITEASAHTAEAASQGESLMKNAMTKMGSIESSVMDSAEVVKKLGENSQQIGQIVDTIAAIADQTNLLALNAAIEAARAGEHGRGFAVVAEEVRKLAAESQSSAEQIKERIASIRTDTERAVAAMQGGTDEVKNGASAIREVGVQFGDIMKMVNAIKDQMEEINGSVQEVSDGAMRIVKAVDSVDDVSRTTSEHTQTISAATEEQSASTEEIASASQALAQMATELQEATGKFRV